MAGILVSAAQAAVTVNTGPVTTVQIVAPANQRLVVKQVICELGAAVFCTITVQKQSDAGTTSALTPVRITPGSETLQSTARHTATGEPTSSAVLYRRKSNVGINLVLTPEDFIVLAGGERLGVTVTSASSVAVDTTIIFEE